MEMKKNLVLKTEIGWILFQVGAMDPTVSTLHPPPDPTIQIFKIVQEDMIDSICPQDQVNNTMDYNLFDYNSAYINMSFLFGCPVSWNGWELGRICAVTMG
uniref:Uncharacterized protein n=1 Tax=Lactuca sativa TaxID=4236 RepID=A0A9R1XPW6_LACSA|nr:hypothetical protein LSAT_V11C200063640 [Lactuca sativa]